MYVRSKSQEQKVVLARIMAVRGKMNQRNQSLSLEEAMASANVHELTLMRDSKLMTRVSVFGAVSVVTVWKDRTRIGIVGNMRKVQVLILLLRLEQRSSKQVVLGRLMI